MNLPNLITIFRVLLLLVIVVLIFSRNKIIYTTLIFLLIIVFALDALDGYIARKLNQATKLGSILDITGDRIVENVLWIVFASINLIPVWVPVVVIIRVFVTDGIRSFALTKGKTAFGKKTMMTSKVGQFLTASRFMRGLYGALKLLTFMLLIAVLIFHPLLKISRIFVYITVFICLLRGIPVIIDSRHFFK